MPKEGYDWQEIVEIKPQGYAEFQFHKEGLVFHGPVKSVEISNGDIVVITLEWVAQMGLPGQASFGTWVRGPENMKIIRFPNLVVPFTYQDTEKGRRIIFSGKSGDAHLLYLDSVKSPVKI